MATPLSEDGSRTASDRSGPQSPPFRTRHVDSSSTDGALMAAYIEGDDSAFRIVFERYAPFLLRLARRHLPPGGLAEEIVQHSFLRLHEARHDFRPGSTLRPWLWTITMNLVRDHWRLHKGWKPSILQADTHPAPAPELMPIEIRERAKLLHEALEKLPETQRAVLELHWFEEKPYAEIAAIVGTTEGATRVRAHRACVTLQRLLGPEIGGGPAP